MSDEEPASRYRSGTVVRPLRKEHGLGLFCCVCLSQGESATAAEFDDRESLYEHWTDEHW